MAKALTLGKAHACAQGLRSPVLVSSPAHSKPSSENAPASVIAADLIEDGRASDPLLECFFAVYDCICSTSFCDSYE
ncbi:MAG: hypothetical protein MH252_03875 [Thermosynechococcaceae cyanobacterium MS004]|nr:hypothetical protein [Thermosynechococcaceae cyanobacterium MS004]